MATPPWLSTSRKSAPVVSASDSAFKRDHLGAVNSLSFRSLVEVLPTLAIVEMTLSQQTDLIIVVS